MYKFCNFCPFYFFLKKSLRFQGNHVFDSHSLRCSRGGKIEVKVGLNKSPLKLPDNVLFDTIFLGSLRLI